MTLQTMKTSPDRIATGANKPRIVAPSDAVDLLATLTDSDAPAHLQDAPITEDTQTRAAFMA